MTAMTLVLPSEFWKPRLDRLAGVLAQGDGPLLDADLSASVWAFLDRTGTPPEEMLVLVISDWPEHPEKPPEMLLGWLA